MKKLLFVLIMSLVFVINNVYAGDFYVRPDNATYGAGDGSSYDDAWSGFENIDWGINGVSAGDTLYVCGKHKKTLEVGDNGSANSPIVISGDCSGDNGTIDGGIPVGESHGHEWVASDNDSTLYYLKKSGGGDPGVGNTMRILRDNSTLLDGMRSTDIDDPADLTVGQWCNIDNGTDFPTIYVRDNESGTILNQDEMIAGNKDGIKLSNKKFITIQNIKFLHTSTSIYLPRLPSACNNIHITNTQHQYNHHAVFSSNTGSLTFDNNTVENFGSEAIYITSNLSTITITNNNFMNGFDRWSGTDADAIDIKPGTSNIIITGNTVTNVEGSGISCQANADSTIADNIINDVGKSSQTSKCIQVTPTDNGTKYIINKNWCSNSKQNSDQNGAYGIYIYAASNNVKISADINYNVVGDSYDAIIVRGDVNGLNIYNNTLAGNTAALLFYDGTMSNVEIKNNIFIDANSSYLLWEHDTADVASPVIDYNFYVGQGNYIYWDGGKKDLDTFQDQGYEANGLEGDPLFVDNATDDFHLTPTSPAINKGEDVELDEDIEGTLIPQCLDPDIGAYEYPEGVDADNDSVDDCEDNCPIDSNANQDDTDNDTVGDDCDNCPSDANFDQSDKDTDGTGDVCDADTIYGYVTGDVKNNVQIDLSKNNCGTYNPESTSYTDSAGYYSFGGLDNGTYKVQPTYDNCTFSPTDNSSIVIPQSQIESYDFEADCP